MYVCKYFMNFQGKISNNQHLKLQKSAYHNAVLTLKDCWLNIEQQIFARRCQDIRIIKSKQQQFCWCQQQTFH